MYVFCKPVGSNVVLPPAPILGTEPGPEPEPDAGFVLTPYGGICIVIFSGKSAIRVVLSFIF